MTASSVTPTDAVQNLKQRYSSDSILHQRHKIQFVETYYPRILIACTSIRSSTATATGIHQGYPVAPCVPPETETDPVQRLFCQLNLAFDEQLVMFRP